MATKRKRRRPNAAWRWRSLSEFNPGLRRAIMAAGSMTDLARMLKIKPQAVAQWDEVPSRRILQVERATKVDRRLLRPDLFRGL